MLLQKDKVLCALNTAVLCTALTCYSLASFAERTDRDKPMHLEADRVSIDDANQISTFEGNVKITQGTMIIRGDKIVVTQDSEGFTTGTATGQPASFRQKREGLDEYAEGLGETIKYDSRNETIDLIGNAKIKRDEDEISGDHITYNSKTEVFLVHSAQYPDEDETGNLSHTQGKGRVHAIIQPKNKNIKAAPAEQTATTPSEALPQP